MNKNVYEQFTEFFKNSRVKEAREAFKKISKFEGKEALEKIINENPCNGACNFYVLVTEESCDEKEADPMGWYRRNKGFQKADLLQKFAEAARRRKAEEEVRHQAEEATKKIEENFPHEVTQATVAVVTSQKIGVA